jgi:uncharacterized damage-inducible protein DinB
MKSADLLTDAFERVHEVVEEVAEGLTPEQLSHRIDGRANSIGWLLWHLTRVQDDHVAGVAGIEQVWTAQGFADRFGLPFPVEDIGYGHSSEDVAATQISDPELLIAYHEAVHEQTIAYVKTLTDKDFDRVVDEAWDPPVTLGVRLVSVISDTLQHAGQAAFVRGIITNN